MSTSGIGESSSAHPGDDPNCILDTETKLIHNEY